MRGSCNTFDMKAGRREVYLKGRWEPAEGRQEGWGRGREEG